MAKHPSKMTCAGAPEKMRLRLRVALPSDVAEAKKGHQNSQRCVPKTVVQGMPICSTNFEYEVLYGNMSNRSLGNNAGL